MPQPPDFTRIGAASAPAFSSDGRTVFHLRGSGLPQLWSMPAGGGEGRALTAHDEKLAFLRRAPKDDRVLYGFDRGGDERQQLWLLEGGESRPLTANPAAIHSAASWSPDGARIAYAANDRDERSFDVLVHALDGTGPRRLHHGTGELSVSGWSPDGATILAIEDHEFGEQIPLLIDAATGAARPLPGSARTRFQSLRWDKRSGALWGLTDSGGRDFLALCRIDPDTGAATPIHAPDGRDVEAWSLSPDGGALATVENDSGVSVLRLGPPDGGRPAVEGLPPGGVAGDLAWSPDGARLAFAASTPTQPPGLWLWEAEEIRPLWRPDPEAEAGIPPASFRPYQPVRWTSFDGREIPGWLALPANPPPPGGHPAVVWVHGGPAAQLRPAFRPDTQMLLSQGYAVLLPNVRGSTGQGRRSTESDDVGQRLDSVTDLAHGARWLMARPDIDATRVAVMGQSYGGYMVLAALTEHPELWRAAIDYYGIADFTTLLRDTGPWRVAHRSKEYGDPQRDAALFTRISPIRQADRIRAPLLVAHGTRDPRVPFNESEQIVAALQQRQQPVQFEQFDYAGHGFVRPDDRARIYDAVAGFLRKHLH